MSSAAIALQQELNEERRTLRFEALLTLITLIGLIIAIIAQLAKGPSSLIWFAFILAYLAGGVPAGIGALQELFKGKLDIDLLMVLAALAAAAVGEPRDGAILLFLFSLAGTLEGYAMGNTKRAVASLMKLRPDEASLQLPDGQTKRVAVESLQLADLVVVKPGERIPVDAEISQGQSAIDQSAVTGESVPVDKTVGDLVFAGTVNGHGALLLKVTKLASESTLARMIKLVTEAQEQRSPSERFSNWFGQRYTFFVLLGSITALGVFLLLGRPQADAFYKAATLLVVASPCAIVISVPAAVLSALAAAARKGVLFKGGGALEDFGNAETLALDKTGTLTEGKMRVTDVIALAMPEPEFIKLAASLEAQSEHPLAKSILTYARVQGIEANTPENTRALPGKGVQAEFQGEKFWAGNHKLLAEQGVTLNEQAKEALARLEREGKTPVLIGSDRLLGVIGVADTLRASAKPTLERLKALGLKRFVMLTGDHSSVAYAVAQELGLSKENVYAELLPEDKVDYVKELSKESKVDRKSVV